MAKRGEERAAAGEKTGVFTGLYAVNPATDEPIPVWVADYVLMDYGTGAIMAVPGHDERDGEFAQRHGLPIREVVNEDGVLVDSGQFSGLPAEEAQRAIVEWLGERGRGRPAVSFRLRDWGFSRQRYWGCPIPIVYCEQCGIVPVPEEDLPVVLPDVEDYRPKGKPPLASNEEWLNVPCPSCGGPAVREADTMDTFVDSSWYFLRYVDPHNERAPFERWLVDYWLPVDQYVGGIDHATGHLLYSRFFVKVLNELELVGFREPFQRLFHQGWVRQGGSKMSKSRGNVTAPDELADMYGADAVRLYILFVGPADQDMDWTEEGVEGIARFLRRLWRIVGEAAPRPGAAAGGWAVSAVPQGARDDRAGDRRHRPALRLQHADRGGDGAGQRARPGSGGAGGALRGGDGRLADPAVRPARRGGAVVAAGAREALGAALAGGGRVAAGARDLRAGDPGERQGARPGRGLG